MKKLDQLPKGSRLAISIAIAVAMGVSLNNYSVGIALGIAVFFITRPSKD
jgi:hypothetical protein